MPPHKVYIFEGVCSINSRDIQVANTIIENKKNNPLHSSLSVRLTFTHHLSILVLSARQTNSLFHPKCVCKRKIIFLFQTYFSPRFLSAWKRLAQNKSLDTLVLISSVFLILLSILYHTFYHLSGDMFHLRRKYRPANLNQLLYILRVTRQSCYYFTY